MNKYSGWLIPIMIAGGLLGAIRRRGQRIREEEEKSKNDTAANPRDKSP